MGYQMSCDQDTEDEQVVEQKSVTALPDSVKSEMSLQLEREALMERVRAIYSLVKQESVCMGGSVDSDLLDKSFCSKSWNKLLMAVRNKEHNTGTLFFEVNKWTMAYDSDLVSFDEFEVQDLNIDTDEVLYGMNSKWNALGFKPGLVGGHCIGVDPYYLTNAAEKLGYHSQIILNGRKVNDSMGAFVADAAIKQMIEAGMAPKKATVVILGITFKENCPDTRNSKVVDIINRLKEYEINPVVTDAWADAAVAKHEYGVELVDFAKVPKADCVIVAVGHNEFRSMSTMQLKGLFKDSLPDSEKVLIDVKSLYRKDELDASGMKYWRL